MGKVNYLLVHLTGFSFIFNVKAILEAEATYMENVSMKEFENDIMMEKDSS